MVELFAAAADRAGECIEQITTGAATHADSLTADLAQKVVDAGKAFENVANSVSGQITQVSTIAADKATKTSETVAIARVRELFEDDDEFRTLAMRYMREFERLLGQAGDSDADELLSASLLTADVGKAYMLISRAIDRYAKQLLNPRLGARGLMPPICASLGGCGQKPTSLGDLIDFL